MPQWGNQDDAANSVLSTPAQFNVEANTANRDALFGNTTADAFITGQTVGTFAVSEVEMQAARTDRSVNKPAHAGHVLRVEGSGGRAGRVQTEVLVAMSSITGDTENTTFEDVGLFITLQPVSLSANSTAEESVVFTIDTDVSPAATPVTYVWEANTGGGFTATVDGAVYTGSATTSLTVNSATIADGTQYRVVASATGTGDETSDTAILTITT